MKKVEPFVEFNITEKCVYTCAYCLHKGKERVNATDEVIEGFLDLLKEMGSDFDVNLIGGEPFCHPKFIETAAKIAKMGNKMILYSNMFFPVSSYEKLIDATGDKLKLIHGAVHVASVKDLDANIKNIVEIKKRLNPNTEIRIGSVVTEESFKTIQYIENELAKHDIIFIYVRRIEDGKFIQYPREIENYMKPREHKYNKDLLKGRMVKTKKLLCHAGSKLFHVGVDGTIVRCWSPQTNHWYFGNVADPKSIKLLKAPTPCYASNKMCICQHATARNMYFYSYLAPLYRTIADIKMKFIP